MRIPVHQHALRSASGVAESASEKSFFPAGYMRKHVRGSRIFRAILTSLPVSPYNFLIAGYTALQGWSEDEGNPGKIRSI